VRLRVEQHLGVFLVVGGQGVVPALPGHRRLAHRVGAVGRVVLEPGQGLRIVAGECGSSQSGV
jgi:hypothetical protein